MIKVCKGCVRRKVGCHASCEAYKEEKAQYDAEQAKEREVKLKERDFSCFKIDGIVKAKEKRWLKK